MTAVLHSSSATPPPSGDTTPAVSPSAAAANAAAASFAALTDNLEVLTHNQDGGAWGRAATNDLLASRIKIRSMNFMRGRTFLSRYLILDEAQNLTPKQKTALKQLLKDELEARK